MLYPVFAVNSIVIPSSIATQKINLNKADAKALSHSLKGIGKVKAQAIVNYRQTHGEFKSLDELAYVKGVGHSFVKKNLEKIQAIFSLN